MIILNSGWNEFKCEWWCAAIRQAYPLGSITEVVCFFQSQTAQNTFLDFITTPLPQIKPSTHSSHTQPETSCKVKRGARHMGRDFIIHLQRAIFSSRCRVGVEAFPGTTLAAFPVTCRSHGGGRPRYTCLHYTNTSGLTSQRTPPDGCVIITREPNQRSLIIERVGGGTARRGTCEGI